MIIEDDELDRLVLHQHIKQFENIAVVGSFDSAEKAIPYLNTPIDLIILDIDLPGMNGIEFRKMTKKIPACIFVSSHPEYAIDTFEVDTFDFITKPLKSERFNNSIHKLFDFLEMKAKSENFDALVGENNIRVKEGNNIAQIKMSDILYLEALKDYTRIVTSEKKYCILDSIGSILHKNYFDSFIRIHRSYAVPKHLIRSKNTHEVELVHQIKLPIGRTYKSNLDFFGA
ncbi:two component transcriptional regulator, LytTR family [Chryseobacterium arachidis]|uniref:Two component transcriptional regulator, LytTR family n=2 Tax=Chryseobacterium arachidis TaxID=1416778 RepID=A0A1M5J8C4_9FLAO|nr:LytTR family DNA-binding domain-containing protein [Chryseobacterium arachidis]SHG36490.1 two component transcriptional regulator, LytTR family [Chryseobacterium arachidis]